MINASISFESIQSRKRMCLPIGQNPEWLKWGEKSFLCHEQFYKNKPVILYLSLKWRLTCRKPSVLAIGCYPLKNTNWKSNWGLFCSRTHLHLFSCSSCTSLGSACWSSWPAEWWPWSSETRWAARVELWSPRTFLAIQDHAAVLRSKYRVFKLSLERWLMEVWRQLRPF